VLLGWRVDAFGLRSATPASSVAAAFDDPPRYPGYVWTRDGQRVSEFELTTIAGPDHCGWQTATFLFIAWPIGTVAPTAERTRQYIRDPKAVITASFRDRLRNGALLPPDARATGYRHGSIEVYASASDDNDAIYVVGPGGAERWPRSDPMTLCA
jgi:hypothetical protein